MTSKARKSLEERTQRAILQYAFLRTESATIIALTLILTTLSLVFPDLVPVIPWWVWLAGGVLGEAAIVYSSLTDPKTGREVVARMLRREFQPERLHDSELQAHVEAAFDYRGRITEAIRERRDTVLKDQLTETASQLDEWIEEVYGLAQRLDRFQAERELHAHNRKRAEERIRKLEKKLTQEDDPAVKQDIRYNIESERRQLATIEELETAMERARLRLENTITAMGTIYTQTMLVGAKDIDSGRAKRLRQDIAEEVNELSDVLAAMDEVYAAESSTV